MILRSERSKERAKSALILGHITTGMGERVLTYKLEKLIQDAGYQSASVVDIIELMGESYERFAELNYDLAQSGHAMLEGIASFPLPTSDILLILSWNFSVAAIFATDLPQTRQTVAKLYAHHPDEKIFPMLYEPADLLITESLLANERGFAYGINREKMLYLPHTYPEVSVPRKNEKKTRRIGMVARLEYGKNCEFAIEAVRRLVKEKKQDAVLYLKGDFPKDSLYPDYRRHLMEMLEAYRDEEWLIWDRTHTSFPEVQEIYASFDVLLHPSGAEGGSHVVVEALGLGIPCVVLDCSTNPSLFKGLATFVRTTGKVRQAQLPFYIPDIEDLVSTLEQELSPPDLAKVQERFHPDVARARIPLLFDPDPAKIVDLYEEDRKIYGL